MFKKFKSFYSSIGTFNEEKPQTQLDIYVNINVEFVKDCLNLKLQLFLWLNIEVVCMDVGIQITRGTRRLE
ncbi:hypothetical protein COD18_16260 [Bacillus cereus]|nr:hypothetical protein COD18_16260 [Bacillus cereus]